MHHRLDVVMGFIEGGADALARFQALLPPLVPAAD
jgi:hypothetical protein